MIDDYNENFEKLKIYAVHALTFLIPFKRLDISERK